MIENIINLFKKYFIIILVVYSIILLSEFNSSSGISSVELMWVIIPFAVTLLFRNNKYVSQLGWLKAGVVLSLLSLGLFLLGFVYVLTHSIW